jgi:hypothetical protein
MATTDRSTPVVTADEGTGDVARRLIDTVAEVSAGAGKRLAETADSAGGMIGDADRLLRGRSDQTLGVIGALSLGFAGGLLASGSNRLLIGAALTPAVLVASAAWDRLVRDTRPTRGRAV